MVDLLKIFFDLLNYLYVCILESCPFVFLFFFFFASRSKGQHSLLAKCRERGSLQGEWEARLHVAVSLLPQLYTLDAAPIY